MALDENTQNKKDDFTDFLKSIQEDSPAPGSHEAEFPFPDNFDIAAFGDEPEAAPRKTAAGTEDPLNLDFQNEIKEQTIKNLQDKIAELETRFEDVHRDKAFAASLDAVFEDKEENAYTPQAKSNDEFYQNISKTIETLKGSLENIVNTRLQYEENILKQDQSLISRLREKTSRLKAINLSLNNEVHRSKNEKLESLRRSAEQTKELLTLRMQLTKVEEKARQGDFKLASLEQHLASANEQRAVLDAEISKVREERLATLRQSAVQTKEIMALRLELGRTEEKLRQEEIQTAALKEQLKTLQEQRAALDREIYSTTSQRREAAAVSAGLDKQIEDQAQKISFNGDVVAADAQAARLLREKILSLETELQRLSGEKAAVLLKNDETLRNLEAARAQHDAEISRLKSAQAQEIELLKNQKAQEAAALQRELKLAEDKYRQEETLVNTLKLQIESLQKDLEGLEAQKVDIKEIEFIKESHNAEIENLKNELKNATEKFALQEQDYQKLSRQLQDINLERANLTEEIKTILAVKDEALRQNEDYLKQIQTIRAGHNEVLDALRADLAAMQQRQQQAAAVSEMRNLITVLKNEASSLEQEKVLIDAELKKANTERYALLTSLGEKTKELDAFRARYEQEIATLREEKAKEAASYQARLEAAQGRAVSAQAEATQFKHAITALDTQKTSLTQEDAAGLAARTEEIISLKTKLARAESRFLQDTVLINQLKEQFQAAEGGRTVLDKEVFRLRQENFEAAQALKLREAEVADIKAQLSKTQQQLKEEEAASKQLQQHTAKLKAVNRALDKEVKKVQEEKLAALRKSAEQANEILALREQLSRAGTFQTLDFDNGIISLRKEYEAKVEKLETQLKDASARFAQQVQEIQNLKTDNSRLKNAEEEKLALQHQYKLLSQQTRALEAQLKEYGDKELQETTLARAKTAALSAQIIKLKRDKEELEQRLSQMHAQIKAFNAGEKENAAALTLLKERISGNDDLIDTLKREITVLTTENKDLKEAVDITTRRQRVLEAKIDEVESENKKLTTTMRVNTATLQKAPPPPPKTKTAIPAPPPQKTATKAPPAPATQDADGISPEQTQTTFGGAALNLGALKESVETVEIESPEMDLSQIFDESAPADNNAWENTEHFITDGGKNTATIPPHEWPMSESAYQESLDVTDHAARQHGIRRVGRAPHTYKSEAYSDFLKKTKSVFFRIKWSLFKE